MEKLQTGESGGSKLKTMVPKANYSSIEDQMKRFDKKARPKNRNSAKETESLLANLADEKTWRSAHGEYFHQYFSCNSSYTLEEILGKLKLGDNCINSKKFEALVSLGTDGSIAKNRHEYERFMWLMNRAVLPHRPELLTEAAIMGSIKRLSPKEDEYFYFNLTRDWIENMPQAVARSPVLDMLCASTGDPKVDEQRLDLLRMLVHKTEGHLTMEPKHVELLRERLGKRKCAYALLVLDTITDEMPYQFVNENFRNNEKMVKALDASLEAEGGGAAAKILKRIYSFSGELTVPDSVPPAMRNRWKMAWEIDDIDKKVSTPNFHDPVLSEDVPRALGFMKRHPLEFGATWEKCGVRCFSRYRELELLESASNFLKPDKKGDKKLSVIARNLAETSVAFYMSGNLVGSIMDHTKAIITEVDSDVRLGATVDKIAKKQGRKINLLLIGGHGNAGWGVLLGHIAIGPDAVESLKSIDRIFFSSEDKKIIADIVANMADGGVIILESCSTGDESNGVKPVGLAISEIARKLGKKITVFAPAQDTTTPIVEFNPDGSVRDVRSDVVYVEYKPNGQKVKHPPLVKGK